MTKAFEFYLAFVTCKMSLRLTTLLITRLLFKTLVEQMKSRNHKTVARASPISMRGMTSARGV